MSESQAIARPGRRVGWVIAEDQASTSRKRFGRERPMGIEVNSRGRCRRFKLSRMIRRETQEEISNRVRHPSLTISCVRPGVIAGGRDGARRVRGTTARNKTSSERRVCIRWIAPAPGLGGGRERESASVWAPDGSRSSSCFVRVRLAGFEGC